MIPQKKLCSSKFIIINKIYENQFIFDDLKLKFEEGNEINLTNN